MISANETLLQRLRVDRPYQTVFSFNTTNVSLLCWCFAIKKNFPRVLHVSGLYKKSFWLDIDRHTHIHTTDLVNSMADVSTLALHLLWCCSGVCWSAHWGVIRLEPDVNDGYYISIVVHEVDVTVAVSLSLSQSEHPTTDDRLQYSNEFISAILRFNRHTFGWARSLRQTKDSRGTAGWQRRRWVAVPPPGTGRNVKWCVLTVYTYASQALAHAGFAMADWLFVPVGWQIVCMRRIFVRVALGWSWHGAMFLAWTMHVLKNHEHKENYHIIYVGDVKFSKNTETNADYANICIVLSLIWIIYFSFIYFSFIYCFFLNKIVIFFYYFTNDQMKNVYCSNTIFFK